MVREDTELALSELETTDIDSGDKVFNLSQSARVETKQIKWLKELQAGGKDILKH